MKLRNIALKYRLKLKFLIISLLTFKLFAIEITEVFSFTCSHCYNIEAQVEQASTSKGVVFVPVPLYDPRNLNEVAAISAYFAAVSLGKGNVFKRAYFDAIFVRGLEAYSKEALVYTLNQSGLNNKSFLTLAGSKQTTTMVNYAVNLAIKYNVTSTPTFVVNGTKFYEGENGIQEIFIGN